MRYSEEIYKKVFPDAPKAVPVVESAVSNFPKVDSTPAAVSDQEPEEDLIEVDGGETNGITGNSESVDE